MRCECKALASTGSLCLCSCLAWCSPGSGVSADAVDKNWVVSIPVLWSQTSVVFLCVAGDLVSMTHADVSLCCPAGLRRLRCPISCHAVLCLILHVCCRCRCVGKRSWHWWIRCTSATVKGSRVDHAQRVASLLQVLLTGEPALVSLSVALLEDVLRSNPDALASLYQTGAFFFALAYCGSNLAEIAQLFRVRCVKKCHVGYLGHHPSTLQ